MAARALGLLIAIGSLLALTIPVAAQSYPERVVKIVNPYPPGGSVDVMARILAQKLTETAGQQFIVENRSGGGGNTGADWVAKAEPDGYTLLFTAPGPLAVNQTLYAKGLPFDPARDFAPIALFATSPIILIAHPGVRATNIPGVDRARQEGAGQDQLRLGRYRHDQSSLGRAVEEHGQDRHRARALSRGGPGHE